MPILSDKVQQGVTQIFNSGVVSFGIIPAGTTDLTIHINDMGNNDDINIFTRDGKHIAGTFIHNWIPSSPVSSADVITEQNGFFPSAIYDSSSLNGIGGELPSFSMSKPSQFSYNGMNITYSGDSKIAGTFFQDEELTIDNVTEDLIVIVGGTDLFEGSVTTNG